MSLPPPLRNFTNTRPSVLSSVKRRAAATIHTPGRSRNYMGKHIPGNPATVVENMTGAGSLVAANYLFNNAKPDGLTIANWNSAFVLNQALGDSNIRFDARRFGWIGAPSKGVPVLVIMAFA